MTAGVIDVTTILLLAPKKAHDCCLQGWGASHGPTACFGSIHAIPEGSGVLSLHGLTTSLHVFLLCLSFSSSNPDSISVGHISEEAFVGSSCQHSHRQHLDDFSPSVLSHLSLFTAVGGWKHVKKGQTYSKIPPLLAEGYIYSLRYPWTLLRHCLVGRGQDDARELLAIKQDGLQTPLLALQPSGCHQRAWTLQSCICTAKPFPSHAVCPDCSPRQGLMA